MSDSIQCCFKRYEKKYLITKKQQEVFLETMRQHMQADTYENIRSATYTMIRMTGN